MDGFIYLKWNFYLLYSVKFDISGGFFYQDLVDEFIFFSGEFEISDGHFDMIL